MNIKDAAATGDMAAALNEPTEAGFPFKVGDYIRASQAGLVWLAQNRPAWTPQRLSGKVQRVTLYLFEIASDEQFGVRTWAASDRHLFELDTEARSTKESNPSRLGKMSGDRVHFTIPNSLLIMGSYPHLLEECFDIKPGSYDRDKDLRIICRPSQFARFIILRQNKYGEANDMSCLNMRLVAPVGPRNQIDCSRNTNKVEDFDAC